MERGEFVNAGVVLFSREQAFLGIRIELDEARLRALNGSVDVELVRGHLHALEAVARGDEQGGPLAQLSIAERFYWLTSPRSTVIQVSPVHAGWGADPRAALNQLMDELVRQHH